MRQGGVLKNKEKDAWIKVCPNCGKFIQSSDVVQGAGTLLRSTRGVNPISNLMSCPKCNYSGFPIEVRVGDVQKIQFKNRKINSYDPKETGVRWMRPEFGIGLIMFAAGFVGLFVSPITCSLVAILGAILMLYGLFSKNPRILSS